MNPANFSSRLVLRVALVLLLPSDMAAQDSAADANGLIVGASVGRFHESWEGYSGSVALWTGLIGYRFNPRWALRAEWGPGFGMCDEDAVISVGGVLQQGNCHSHEQIANLSALMALPLSTYLIFGPIHVGLGARIPLGPRLAASAELDLGFGFSSASVWPKGLLTTSF